MTRLLIAACVRGAVGQDRGQVRGDHARRRRHPWHVERRWSSVGTERFSPFSTDVTESCLQLCMDR